MKRKEKEEGDVWILNERPIICEYCGDKVGFGYGHRCKCGRTKLAGLPDGRGFGFSAGGRGGEKEER
jgi:hypothetical protein